MAPTTVFSQKPECVRAGDGPVHLVVCGDVVQQKREFALIKQDFQPADLAADKIAASIQRTFSTLHAGFWTVLCGSKPIDYNNYL